jgi:hypothetical protein
VSNNSRFGSGPVVNGGKLLLPGRISTTLEPVKDEGNHLLVRVDWLLPFSAAHPYRKIYSHAVEIDQDAPYQGSLALFRLLPRNHDVREHTVLTERACLQTVPSLYCSPEIWDLHPK